MTTAVSSPNSGVPALARKRQAGDMSREDWRGLFRGFFKFLMEEEQEPEHAEDDGGMGACIIFVDPDGQVLLLKRSPNETNFGGHWALPGGSAEGDETPEECADRECAEELGGVAIDKDGEKQSLSTTKTPTGMTFHTFVQKVKSQFKPELNSEHTEHAWVPLDQLPEPMHPAVAHKLVGDADPPGVKHDPKDGRFTSGGGGGGSGSKAMSDMQKWYKKNPDDAHEHTHEDIQKKFPHATKEEVASMHSHIQSGGKTSLGGGKDMAMDPPVSEKQRRAMEAAAHGHSTLGIPKSVAEKFVGHAHDSYAFDRATVRDYDRSGRLHVKLTNISKATINPYLGKEIPGWQELGLQADKIYQLLRDPEELAKAAPTFNGLPLVVKHVPTSAEDHPTDKVVGATGTDAEFVAPYLRNSLVIWPQESIENVEDGTQKELSCGYHYRPDMTPGEYEGQRYDGVMRDIVGNHVALVEKGRAGSDVVVGDAALPGMTTEEEPIMALKTRTGIYLHGALSTFFRGGPSKQVALALDAALKDVSAVNFQDKKPGLKATLKTIKETMAKDADLEGMNNMLDGMEKPPVEAKDDPLQEDPNNGETIDADETEEEKAEREKKSKEAKDAFENSEEYKQAKAAHDKRMAKDNPPPFKGRPEPGGTMTKDELAEEVRKATELAVRTANDNAKATREAEKAVKPWVGELALACDSAEEVYRTALKMLGVNTKGVHPSALRPILEAQPIPGGRQQTTRTTMAADSSISKGYDQMFPGAKRIGVL